MSEPQSDGTAEIAEALLRDVQGGLLVPAVQKVREAAARLSGSADDELVITGSGLGGSAHVK